MTTLKDLISTAGRAHTACVSFAAETARETHATILDADPRQISQLRHDLTRSITLLTQVLDIIDATRTGDQPAPCPRNEIPSHYSSVAHIRDITGDDWHTIANKLNSSPTIPGTKWTAHAARAAAVHHHQSMHHHPETTPTPKDATP